MTEDCAAVGLTGEGRCIEPAVGGTLCEHHAATTATIRPMPRPRGTPTADEVRLMERLRERAERAAKNHRDYVVGVLLNGGSFAEVSKATGLSTNTLQRWKREAGR